MEHCTLGRSGRTLRSAATVCLAAVALAASRPEPAEAKDKYMVAYVAPSLDISYWQWVAYGAKTKAAELGMDYVEMT
jgi:ribose transport system substrate-binding protein